MDSAGFLGRGWAFPPRLNGYSGDAVLVQEDADVAESLRILMSTRPGERIMHPDYGCRLQDLVFETNSPETHSAAETAIRQAILFYEPRITLHRVDVDLSDWLEGRMLITLSYSIDATNSRSNMVFPFYESEGTLVSNTPVLAL
jgi:hypothetical protein